MIVIQNITKCSVETNKRDCRLRIFFTRQISNEQRKKCAKMSSYHLLVFRVIFVGRWLLYKCQPMIKLLTPRPMGKMSKEKKQASKLKHNVIITIAPLWILLSCFQKRSKISAEKKIVSSIAMLVVCVFLSDNNVANGDAAITTHHMCKVNCVDGVTDLLKAYSHWHNTKFEEEKIKQQQINETINYLIVLSILLHSIHFNENRKRTEKEVLLYFCLIASDHRPDSFFGTIQRFCSWKLCI